MNSGLGPLAHAPLAHEPLAHEPLAHEPLAHKPLAHEPLALGIDGTGNSSAVPTLALHAMQEALRFSASVAALQAFAKQLPTEIAGPVLLGSGDFHHLSLPLIARQSAHQGLRVLVLDNHPDNMRYLFGVHCGSWVRRVCALPFVHSVHVLGISSNDVSKDQAWANYLAPLRAGKLRYSCLSVNTDWALRRGLEKQIRTYVSPQAMIDALRCELRASHAPIYCSIDKDVLAKTVVQTNWDQGLLLEADLMALIACMQGHIVGADICGEVSSFRYRSWLKRWLSGLDQQQLPDPTLLPQWQMQHDALNARLLAALADAWQAPLGSAQNAHR